MENQKDYITLLNDFFAEISKEELSAIISQIEDRKHHGITVNEYLDSENGESIETKSQDQ